MRKITLACLAVLAASGSIIANAPQAQAYDYPYCLQNRSVGIPGDCSYQNYAQCMDSASGRGASCNVNPRAAFNQLSRQRIQRQ